MMIITPREIEDWIHQKKPFLAVDIRSEDQRKAFPLEGIKFVVADENSIPEFEYERVLICQFGMVTEELILNQDLENTYSLLGGVQAWNAFRTDQRDLSRWSRQTVLPEIGLEGQKKLMEATVAIVGIGGLGCPAAQSLVMAGIGKIKIMDGDIVELSNLHRQSLFGEKDVGCMKVEIAKEKLKKINNETDIEITGKYFDEITGLEFIRGADVVIDATDNIKTRQLIDRFSKTTHVPMIYGGLYRWEGQVAVLNAKGCGGYKELFPSHSSGGDTCADGGVLGMLPAIIGHIQALEAIKWICGIEPSLIGKLLIYDGLTHQTQIFKL